MATSLIVQGVRFPNTSVQRVAFPGKGVVPWFGLIENIPSGWRYCDGSNGTPDLRGKFVLGAGGLYAVGSTGGLESVILASPHLPAHSHDGAVDTDTAGSHNHSASTSTDGSHNHSFSPTGVIGPSGPSPFGPGSSNVQGFSMGPGGSHSHSNITTGSAGGHAHPITATINPAGAGDPHENRPPYIAIPFIMMEP